MGQPSRLLKMRPRSPLPLEPVRVGKAARNSEGDLVVDGLVEIGLRAAATAPAAPPIAIAWGTVIPVLVILHAKVGAAAAAAVEHGERAVEALQHDLGRIAVLAVLALPLARLQLAFDVNFGTLLQVLLGDPAQPFVEDHHGVPLCLFAPLSRRLVAPSLGGGNAQVGDGTAVLRTADLGILAEIANQDDLVDGTGHETLLLKRFFRSAALVPTAQACRPGLAPRHPLAGPSPRTGRTHAGL